MTVASKGLQKALARAGGSVIAIAEMQADDLLAELTDEQKAAISAALAPKASASAPAAPIPGAKADDEPGDEPGEEKPDEKAKKKAEASADANASERDRVKAVAKAVAEDDACKGKADLALAMLADDDFAGLNAAAMVKMLGKQAAPAGESDPDAAARAEMKDAIRSTSNSGIDANGGGKKDKAEDSAAVWDAAIAKVAPNSAK